MIVEKKEAFSIILIKQDGEDLPEVSIFETISSTTVERPSVVCQVFS